MGFVIYDKVINEFQSSSISVFLRKENVRVICVVDGLEWRISIWMMDDSAAGPPARFLYLASIAVTAH